MSDRRAYDPGLPLYASWSFESPVYTTMLTLQTEGNETRILASRSWENAALSQCFNEVMTLYPWRQWTVHIIPSDRRLNWQPILERFGWYVEQAPDLSDYLAPARELMHTLKIDNVERQWTAHEKNNQEFIDAIGQHAPRKVAQYDGFNVALQHNLSTFYMRALEVFAAWRHAGNGRLPQWRRPDYTLFDRAVI